MLRLPIWQQRHFQHVLNGIGLFLAVNKSADLPEKMMRLSKAQAAVIDALKNGWELGVRSGPPGRVWIQEGGVGRGGKSKTVSSITFNILGNGGHLKLVESGYPIRKYTAAPMPPSAAQESQRSDAYQTAVHQCGS